MGKKNSRVCLKIWIEGETGETLFGEGQLKILSAIEKEGSINAAAKSLGMGYRSMWGRLRKIETRLGKSLLVRHKGGISGGKSVLTEDAKRMVDQFRKIQQQMNDMAGSIHTDMYT
jgi:molybdate transport system regulatory protein